MARTKIRRKLFVDKRVQGILIRQILIHWALAISVMFLYLLIMQVFSSPTRLSLGGHLSMMWSKYGILLIALVTVFPVFVYDSIKLSNRFAGPMVSFRNALDNLAKGQPMNGIRFRNNDFWHEISGNLNAVARRMNLLADNGPAKTESRNATS